MPYWIGSQRKVGKLATAKTQQRDDLTALKMRTTTDNVTPMTHITIKN
ncbi:hypothetical phage protein [Burkholderia cenocepacia J2315]|uniref:Hypothetical phage protein n=1 Tax=Burkholderia cenocepacia (strain ATCC BAA-245 / DSM 16553 / LMG 16656 / NCTC 13227 / J2315 / CF5610) TaxID=216591 RepID=B4EMG9_BURCJ|nr:hypothetical phage protein [Burkholderia cenocepacia J2315]